MLGGVILFFLKIKKRFLSSLYCLPIHNKNLESKLL
ncbi:hypothetical protein CpecS_0539 [Chlamydia pecorum VR629]|nr:hypothetical protein CpecS_0539 [Chlamydia pecorum VR629]